MTTTELRKAAHTSRKVTHQADNGTARAREGAATAWSGAVDAVRATAEDVGSRLPDLASAGVDGATVSVRVLQGLPESKLELLAAFSLGAGSSLWLVGAPRLVTIIALAPALLAGVALASRQRGDQDLGESAGARGTRD